jgi:tetratricopeptide (TPR) repeat protein
MGQDIVAIIERLFKAFIFVPCIALIAWWLFSAWLENLLSLGEAAVGLTLLAGAFVLGVTSIVSGGWGFLGILAIIYILLLSILVWEYVYWRRREHQHLLDEVGKYQDAIALDPKNAAAYSFLGNTHLALGNPDEAIAAIEQALALDPESHTDRSLMIRAREMQSRTALKRARKR